MRPSQAHIVTLPSLVHAAGFVPAYSIDTVILYFPYAPSTVNSYLIHRISTFYPLRPLRYRAASKYPYDTRHPANSILVWVHRKAGLVHFDHLPSNSRATT